MLNHQPSVARPAVLATVVVLLAAPACGAQDDALKTIAFQHDGRDTTGYVLYARPDGGRELRIDLGPLHPDPAGTLRVALPHLPAGKYELAIAAYNAGGESAKVVAVPATVNIARQPDSRVDRTGSKDAVAPPIVTADQPAPAARTGPAERPGMLRRLWRLIVGNDP